MKIFKQIRQKFKRNVEESVPNELETKPKSRSKRQKVRNVMAVAGIVLAAFVGVNSMSVRAATSGNVNGVINQGGVGFSANGSWSVSASRSGNTVTITVNGSLTIPNGCWEGLSLYVTNNKGAGDRSVQIAADGSAWPKTGSGSTSYSFTDANAGTASGRIYLGFRSNPTGGLWADYSIGYSSGTKKEHKVHYDLNGGSWNTTAISNPNGYKIIDDGNYQIQWGYNSSYYVHTKSSNAQALGIHMWQDSSNENSIWYFERYMNTPYYFIVGNNGWDLASYGTERVDEANQVNDGSRNNHLWAIEEMSNGNIALKNVGTGRYIFSHYASAGNGNSIGLWGNHDATDCQWKLVKKYTGTSAYRKKLYGNTFYVNQKTPVKPGYIFNGWASRPEWDTRAKSVSINGRTFDRYFIQPIGGNRFEVMVHTTDSRITQVSVPVWSDANGQDDLQWPSLGKGTWTRDGQSFNWGAQITIPEEISHYSMHIYTGINGAWEEASGSSGLDSVWTIGEQYTFDTNTDGTMYATWRKDDTQYQQTVNVRFENADGSFTSYQQAHQRTVKAGETFTWEYPSNDIYKGTKISYTVSGEKTTDVTIYRNKKKLDINGNVNGSVIDNITGVGTFDIYVNGKQVGNDVSDYMENLRYGSTYEIKDVKALSGYRYTGVVSGSLTGTMGKSEIKVQLGFECSDINVTYKANGGEGKDKKQTISYGKEWTTKGSIFTRKGYKLSSWNTKADGSGTKYNLNTKQTSTPSADMTLYAQWTPITYTIRYHANGGSGSMRDQVLTYDKEEKLTKSTFSKSPYVFTGWNTKEDLTGDFYFNEANVINLTDQDGAVIDLYAIYSETVNLIFYDLDGGTDPGNPTEYSTVTPDFDLLEPVKTGYTFTGWTGSNGTTPQKNVTIKQGRNENLNFTAHWTPNTYTVVYNGNGSTSGSMANTSMTYDTKGTLRANTYQRTGYKFAGWNTMPDGSGQDYVDKESVLNLTSEANGKVTLYAQWKNTPVTVTFDGNGGSDPEPMKKQVGDTLGNLPTSTREGYTFVGWFTAKSGGTQIKSNTKVPEKDVTYYAHWKTDRFIIQYDLDGGKVSGNPETYTPESADITLKNPTREGYTFIGWTGSNGNNPQMTVTIKKGSIGDKSYKANWKAHTYTIVYNGNGSTSGSTPSSTHTYDVAKNLTENGFSRRGYSFAGWNTKADGSGASYKNAQSVKNLTSSNRDTLNLYAMWTVKQYTITYNPNMDASSNYVMIDAGQKATSRAGETTGGTQTKYKIEFLTVDYEKGLLSVRITGYYRALNGDVKKFVSQKTNFVDVLGDYATKKLTFDANGGTCDVDSMLFVVNTKPAKLPTPARDGYTFDGWYTAKDGGVRITTNSNLGNDNFTVYAHWTKNNS